MYFQRFSLFLHNTAALLLKNSSLGLENSQLIRYCGHYGDQFESRAGPESDFVVCRKPLVPASGLIEAF